MPAPANSSPWRARTRGSRITIGSGTTGRPCILRVCVAPQRKPGADPLELFLDPAVPLGKLKMAACSLQGRLGFRSVMDVTPLDAALVKGSHGGRPASVRDYPLFITPRPDLLANAQVTAPEVYHLLKRHVLV